MVVVAAIIISLIPAILIAYPVIKKIASRTPLPEDESSLRADLERRWESALEGIRHAELEMSIGNLNEADYLWLKQVHMAEAANVLKTLEISSEKERLLIEEISSAANTKSLDSSFKNGHEKEDWD